MVTEFFFLLNDNKHLIARTSKIGYLICIYIYPSSKDTYAQAFKIVAFLSLRMFTDSVLEALASRIDSHYTLHHDPNVRPLSYGTAGFRTTGELLPPVAARVILVAVLRAWFQGAQQAADGQKSTSSVGFMITASHNPAVDNGFKIIDTDGGMLTASWEHWCTAAANAATGADLVNVVKNCTETVGIREVLNMTSPCGVVLLGRDTRGSGTVIEAAASDILSNVLKISFTNFGVLTTPQLHFLVATANESNAAAAHIHLDAYNEQILSSLEELFAHTKKGNEATVALPQRLVVDCANGVGALGMQRLLSYSRSRPKGDILSKLFCVELVNVSVENPDALNENCGADYAKQFSKPSESMQQWPRSNSEESDVLPAHFYCMDGDADRIVAFLSAHSRAANWVLLDGDRLAILYAMLLHKWIGEEQMKVLDMGVVQTAYANGASTEFLKSELHVPVYIAATGVKNLHPVAHARDIGVYFEANGHGTVLFSDGIVKNTRESSLGKIAPLLRNLRGLLSQVCGDAIGDMFMCEVALQALEMKFEDWADLYTDRPCKQIKVTVQHPKRITNTRDEQRALSPDGMQDEIDAAVAAVLSTCRAARSFVRPSGTEPVVRVYAEASTPAACDSLAVEVRSIVERYCN